MGCMYFFYSFREWDMFQIWDVIFVTLVGLKDEEKLILQLSLLRPLGYNHTERQRQH